jgi:cobalt-precorrin 5A hydrolase/precorrin-3B C17-methyltransferase
MSAAAAIVVLTAGGRTLAGRLRDALPGASIHGLRRRIPDVDVAFDDTMTHLAGLFAARTPIVGICAAGILIRAVAPMLGDKRNEPPMLALAEDGSAVVPLLGGHVGGNAMARHIADTLGIVAALTTAGDAVFGLALDEPPPGWTVANPPAAKTMMAALLAGEPVRLTIEAGDAGWLTAGQAGWAEHADHAVLVTDRAVAGDAATLVLHPPTLALGIGCERGTDPTELTALVDATLADNGLAAASVALVGSLDLKMDEPAVHALASHLGVPARFFDAATLEAEAPRLANPSDYVFRTVGCHGVAEGAALAAAGPCGALVVAKTRSPRATCAIARATALDPATIGRPQGRLTILGTGPGDAAYRLPAADAALADATDIVGYGLYTDLLGAAAARLVRHDFALGEEEARCRHALDLAAEDRRVVLVSSGDPGIYAMAALVFELLDGADAAPWARVAVDVVPGLSAMQLAAARAGAPLGHDFCTISLSDLLTPWTIIEARIDAAAAADFVIAFYNPVSRRRQGQLVRARDILLAHRPPQTPVIVARNLARDGESIEILTLGELDPARLDMLSLVIVGSSESRALRRAGRDHVYTPRGYAPGVTQTTADRTSKA